MESYLPIPIYNLEKNWKQKKKNYLLFIKAGYKLSYGCLFLQKLSNRNKKMDINKNYIGVGALISMISLSDLLCFCQHIFQINRHLLIAGVPVTTRGKG